MQTAAQLVDLGHMAYAPCVEYQKALLEDVLSGAKPSTLLFVEHDPVLTLGVNFHEENLLLSQTEYQARGIEIIKTDRGGDVTYHCPGQLVIYPIFNLAEIGKDLHLWLRNLEQTMIVTLDAFGLEGERFPPNTGVWINGRKIAAIGIKIRRWVSMHGIALNCNNNLGPFESIVPCGIKDYGVTSLSEELRRTVTTQEVKQIVRESFKSVFNLELAEVHGSY